MKKKLNRCYESMTKIQVGQFTIRVWRTEKFFFTGPDVSVTRILNNIKTPTSAIISRELDKIPDIAAYEILYPLGNGYVVYPDWK